MTLRVLHCLYDDVANPWVGGGGAVRAQALYRALGARVDVTLLSGAFPGAEDGVRDGVKRRFVGVGASYALSRASYVPAAQGELLLGAWDVAVIDFSAWSPLFAPSHRRVGVIVHHLTGRAARARVGTPAGLVVERLERALLRRARQVCVPSEATRRELAPLLASSARISVVKGGVDDVLFTLPRAPSPLVLFLGRLDVVQKGLDVLVAAFARVAQVRPEVRLTIAGRGRDADVVRALVDRAGLARSIDVVGPVTEAEHHALLSRAAACVMPSRFEGFGLAAAEALAAGVPLVASRLPALEEVCGEAARFVPAGDAAALGDALLEVLADEALRERLACAGRVQAEALRWSTAAQDHLRFLEAVAEQR